MPQFVCHIIPKIKSAFNSCSLTTKNRFSAAKSRIPKRSKIPDPYDDSCNLTGSYHMKSSPTTLNTQVDSMNTTLGPREKSSDVGSHKNPATQDLESGIHRWNWWGRFNVHLERTARSCSHPAWSASNRRLCLFSELWRTYSIHALNMSWRVSKHVIAISMGENSENHVDVQNWNE